jgi:ribosomal protein L14E/L6E/L27E
MSAFRNTKLVVITGIDDRSVFVCGQSQAAGLKFSIFDSGGRRI